MSERAPGRPRDQQIDDRVLLETRRQLAAVGYEGLSIAGVADAAGTTRQAVYRRWESKADLATAAIAAMSQEHSRPATEDPFADLVDELQAFRRGISRPDGLSMIGTMLHASTEPTLVDHFRGRIVLPRRARIVGILERGRAAGLLDAGGDLALAAGLCTGSWYALALAGDPAPVDWAERVASLVWRSLGGTPGGSVTDP